MSPGGACGHLRAQPVEVARSPLPGDELAIEDGPIGQQVDQSPELGDRFGDETGAAGPDAQTAVDVDEGAPAVELGLHP